jgi:hypothetical protein
MRKLVSNTWHMNLHKDGFYVLCVFFNNVDLNFLATWKSVGFNILNFSTHWSSSYSMNKNLENQVVLLGFT